MKLAFLLPLSLLTIILFKDIEITLINLNLSWSASKITPYIIVLIFGIFLGLKILTSKLLVPKIVKLTIALVLFIAPFSIAFAINPIYEGDFNKVGKKVTSERKIEEFKTLDFVVLTIPGCPFCYESVAQINLLQKRNPKLRIKYIVCSSNSTTKNELRKKLNSQIKIDLSNNLTELLKLSEGKFPCFLKIKDTKAIYKWHNNQFGAGAKDKVESNDF